MACPNTKSQMAPVLWLLPGWPWLSLTHTELGPETRWRSTGWDSWRETAKRSMTPRDQLAIFSQCCKGTSWAWRSWQLPGDESKGVSLNDPKWLVAFWDFLNTYYVIEELNDFDSDSICSVYPCRTFQTISNSSTSCRSAEESWTGTSSPGLVCPNWLVINAKRRHLGSAQLSEAAAELVDCLRPKPAGYEGKHLPLNAFCLNIIDCLLEICWMFLVRPVLTLSTTCFVFCIFNLL